MNVNSILKIESNSFFPTLDWFDKMSFLITVRYQLFLLSLLICLCLPIAGWDKAKANACEKRIAGETCYKPCLAKFSVKKESINKKTISDKEKAKELCKESLKKAKCIVSSIKGKCKPAEEVAFASALNDKSNSTELSSWIWSDCLAARKKAGITGTGDLDDLNLSNNSGGSEGSGSKGVSAAATISASIALFILPIVISVLLFHYFKV